MTTTRPRDDYPRPQFARDPWVNLNGTWEFEFDDERIGEKSKWHEREAFARRIEVPFCCQSRLSGIGDSAFHDTVWYRRTFAVPEAFAGRRIVLHFGAVDYEAKVWVNGRLAAVHVGGHTPFQADITDLLQDGDNAIVVRAHDDSTDVTIPRGKQYWKERSEFIFYTRTTGIWQTVWLEAVADVHLQRVRLTPDIDRHEIRIASFVSEVPAGADVRLQAAISFGGATVAVESFRVFAREQSRTVKLHEFGDYYLSRLWSPEKPNLYDIRFTLTVNGVETDRVDSYFGMRKIAAEDGKLCLNNKPYRMKLVLDQGYFPEGLLTAPSDEALRRDVELTKELGFNGARKHQKIEDPRYLYWCDRLGLLVWGEMANAYHYSEAYVRRIHAEWQEAIERDYNHPSLVVWVPLNESWGVPNIASDVCQQEHAASLYHLTRSLDPTRPVVSNDGWEHVRSDLCTIHDYTPDGETLTERYRSVERALGDMPCGKKIHVGGHAYRGEPIVVSEFGGISFRTGEQEGWGYSGADGEEDYVKRLEAVVAPMRNSPLVQGYCYTQLTDVEQEINGLLTCDRQPKAPLETIRRIIGG